MTDHIPDEVIEAVARAVMEAEVRLDPDFGDVPWEELDIHGRDFYLTVGEQAALAYRKATRERGVVDKINEAVCEILRQRARQGVETYGETVADSKLSTQDWLVHLQDELLDAAVYVEKLKAMLAAAEGK